MSVLSTLILKHGSTWVGSESAYHAVLDAYTKMDAADEVLKVNALAYDDDEEREQRHFLLEMVDNVGIITIDGSMVSGVEGSWGAYWGVVGYGDIRNAIVTAINGGAEELLFDMNTPGGSTNGIMELSDFIKSLDVKTTAHSGGMVASGGLWLATAADSFYASRMAEIGSLGVIAITQEITDMYKDAGINIRVFKSTPLKAAGNPYEKMSPEMAAEIQKNIDETHKFFVREVAINMGLTEEYVSAEIANGKMWYAAEANQLGLIDGVKSFDDVFLAMRRETTDNAGDFSNKEFNNNLEADMAKRKLTLDAQASAAIASGVPVEQAVADKELDKGTEAEVKVEAEETKDDTVEASAETEVEESTDADESAEEGKDAAVSGILKQLSTAQAESVDLKVEVKVLQGKLATMEASQEGLKKVTAVSIQRAYVAIGSPAPELESLVASDASVLLAQHAQVDAQLSQRFGAGQQVSVQVEEVDDEALDAAAQHTNETMLKQARI